MTRIIAFFLCFGITACAGIQRAQRPGDPEPRYTAPGRIETESLDLGPGQSLSVTEENRTNLIHTDPESFKAALQAATNQSQKSGDVNSQVSILQLVEANSNLVNQNRELQVYVDSVLSSLSDSLDMGLVKQCAQGTDLKFSYLKAYCFLTVGHHGLKSGQQELLSWAIENGKGLDPRWDNSFASLEVEVSSLRTVREQNIGVILPLSGRQSRVAQAALRGIQLGFGLTGDRPSPFQLFLEDSRGLPDEAERAVERLIREHNVIAIIGDVSSRLAPAIINKAQQYRVPVLLLTQKTFEGQEFGFFNSFTYQAQARALVSYARSRLGVERFGILYPTDAYGQDFSQAFWDEVLAQGGQVVAAQKYPPRETDFSEQVRKLLGLFYLDARTSEVRLIEKERAQEPAGRRRFDVVEKMSPFNHVQAIFVPDSISALGQISARLSFFRANQIPILGPNLWNQNEVIRRAAQASDRVYFVDQFNLQSAEAKASEFYRSHQRYFQEAPSNITLYGYDSALLLRQLIASGNTQRETLGRALKQIREVPGGLSPLSAGARGEIRRPSQILGIRQNQIQSIEVIR